MFIILILGRNLCIHIDDDIYPIASAYDANLISVTHIGFKTNGNKYFYNCKPPKKEECVCNGTSGGGGGDDGGGFNGLTLPFFKMTMVILSKFN